MAGNTRHLLQNFKPFNLPYVRFSRYENLLLSLDANPVLSRIDATQRQVPQACRLTLA